MSQNPKETQIMLEPSQQPFNRRDFLKRSSIIPAAGALSLVGGSALLMAPMTASAATDPDKNLYDYVGRIYFGRQEMPWIRGYEDSYVEYYAGRQNATDKNSFSQIWKLKVRTAYSSGTTREYTYFGQCGVIYTSNGKQVMAAYNSAGQTIMILQPEAWACADRDGRRLATDTKMSQFYPANSVARTLVVAKRAWSALPMFMHISYTVGRNTYYRFARLVGDSYQITSALEGSADAAFIKEFIDALAKYDDAVLAIRVSLGGGLAGAAAGTGLGLTDAATGIAAYGVATLIAAVPIAAAKIGLNDIHKVSQANVAVGAVFAKTALTNFASAVTQVCLPEDQVRL